MSFTSSTISNLPAVDTGTLDRSLSFMEITDQNGNSRKIPPDKVVPTSVIDPVANKWLRGDTGGNEFDRLTDQEVGENLTFDVGSAYVNTIPRTLVSHLNSVLRAENFATGDGVTDDTAGLQEMFDEMLATGKRVEFGPGDFLTDKLEIPYDANERTNIRGAGFVNTLLKKKTADTGGVLEIGENTLNTQTFSGGMVIEGIGIQGAGTNAYGLRLKSLTAGGVRNIKVTSAGTGIDVVNCVTNTFYNCVSDANTTGWKFSKTAYGDATGSRSNLNTMTNCKATNNTSWGITYQDATLLAMLGCQIEANGDTGTALSGGLRLTAEAGDLSVNPEGIGVIANGCWFENNHGGQAVRILGGIFTAVGSQWVANTVREVYNNGGLYHLIGCSIPVDRSGGNILDDTSAIAGNTISGGWIANLTGTAAAKTDIFNVNSGTAATPTRNHRVRGHTPMIFQGSTQMIAQSGSTKTDTGGLEVVTFPLAFSGTPDVFCQPKVNASTRVYSVKAYSISTTGFTAQMQYVANGSSTVNNANDSFDWFAVGSL